MIYISVLMSDLSGYDYGSRHQQTLESGPEQLQHPDSYQTPLTWGPASLAPKCGLHLGGQTGLGLKANAASASH